MSTYNEIKALIKDLNENKIKQRRNAGEKLQSLLSYPETRQRLAMEVSIPNSQRGLLSIEGARRMALAEVWRLIIQSSIASVQFILDGKSKITESDIILPYKLIRSCDIPDDACGAWNHYSDPKLDKKSTRIVFEYCMEMLDNRETVDLAELPLLQMLTYICSRREYVAYFKPNGEISAILEEVESRILSNDRARDHNILIEVGKAFENLMKTAKLLGLGLDLLIPGSVKMVANWCNLRKSDDYVAEFPYLINGLCVLLESNPEQAVKPLARHGHIILTFTQKRYNSSTSTQRNIIHKYWLRHLISAQLCGKWSGMMPGDVGDLGLATLSYKHISNLLELALQDLGKYAFDFLRVDEAQRIHMELLARLLACAQRLYLQDLEWIEVECLLKNIVKSDESLADDHMFKFLQKPNHSMTPTAKAHDLSNSPFVIHVLGPLYSLACGSSMTNDTNMHLKDSPLLVGAMKRDSNNRTDQRQLLPLIQMLLSCAEFFPTGSCWTSNSSESWKHHKINTDLGSDIFLVSVSSVTDLASVVHTATNVLECYGGQSGSGTMQACTLLCLCRLCEAHAISDLSTENLEAHRREAIIVEWRRVWTILFRPDLRYVSCIKAPTQGNNGELVLALLNNIIRFRCTEDTEKEDSRKFIFMQQPNLWALPVYSTPSIESIFPLVLMYSVLFFNGLNDDTGTAQCTSTESGNTRYKLLLYCLQFCTKMTGRPQCQNIVCMASICASSLCHGRSPLPEKIFSIVNQSLYPTAATFLPSAIVQRKEDSTNLLKEESDIFTDIVSFLWTTMDSLPNLSLLHPDDFVDDVIGNIIKVRDLLRTSEKTLKARDFVPQSQSKFLFEILRSQLGDLSSSEVGLTHERLGESSSSSEVCLPLQAIRAKVNLTCEFSRHSAFEDSEFESILNDVSLIFAAGASCIKIDNEIDDVLCLDFCSIVRSIFYASSVNRFALPSIYVQNAIALQRACQTLLGMYSPFEETETSKYSKQNNNVKDSLMDDDSDDIASLGSSKHENYEVISDTMKRKREMKKGTSMRKKTCNRKFFLKRFSVVIVGELLLSLSPTSSDCELVAKSLIGCDAFDISQASQYSVDALGCVYALELICTYPPLLHSSAQGKINEHDTIGLSLPILVCKIVKLLHIVVKPYSDFFLYGYSTCAHLVSLVDSEFSSCKLTEVEAKEIAEVFRISDKFPDRRIFGNRPNIRALHLVSAIHMFKHGKGNFHAVFDKEFPRSFVLPSLQDINGTIRRYACKAVASAMSILPEEKVVDSVRKRFQDFLNASSDEEVRQEFRKWFDDKNIQGPDSFSSRGKQVWEDSFPSVESSIIDCMVTIALHSTKCEIISHVIFDLLRLSVFRPLSGASIYRAVEKLSIHAGHSTVDGFLETFYDDLLMKWIQEDESLVRVPWILSFSPFYKTLIKHGHFQSFVSDDEESDFVQIMEPARRKFLIKVSGLLLPKLLVNAIGKEVVKENDVKNSFAHNENIVELCSIFYGNYDEQVFSHLLRKNLAHILAFNSLLKSVSLESECNTWNLTGILKLFIPDDLFRIQCKKQANCALRQLIVNLGRVTNSISVECGLRSMHYLFEEVADEKIQSGDVFQSMSSSLVEALVFTRSCIDKCVNRRERSKMWIAYECILNFSTERICLKGTSPSQISFIVHSLLGIIVDGNSCSVRPEALHTLTKIATSIFDSKDEKLSSGVIKDLICVVFQVHESCQQEIIRECSKMKNLKEKVIGQSLGLGGREIQGSDPWGWNNIGLKQTVSESSNMFVEHITSVLPPVKETLTATYGVLLEFVNHAHNASIVKDILAFLPLGNEDMNLQKELSAASETFCAQVRIRDFLFTERFHSDSNGNGIQLPAIITRVRDHRIRRTFATSLLRTHDSISSTNHTLLLAELKELENYLTSRENDICDEDKAALSILLREYCTLSDAIDVKLLASTCLGEIQMSKIEVREYMPENDWIGTAILKGTLVAAMRCSCIEALAKAVRSHRSLIAMTALETLKAVLTTRIRDECQEHLDDVEILDLLDSLLSRNNASQQLKHLYLESEEIASCAGSYMTRNCSEWCWNTKLWISDMKDDHSYEAWICRIVPSLLLCCYNVSDDLKQSARHANFFVCCQRMSLVDPAFAEVLFPLIVIDLLVNSKVESSLKPTIDLVLLDTWISSVNCPNRLRLSECFTVVLERFCNQIDLVQNLDNRPIILLIQCIEILRRLTLHRFGSSTNHKRNEDRRKVENSRQSSSSDLVIQERSLKRNVEIIPWRGIPYGTVLNLDGILLSKACILANTFTASLLYAEIFAYTNFPDMGTSLAAKQDIPQSELKRDISGFCMQREDDSTPPSPISQNDLLGLLDAFKTSYTKLGEQDATRALDQDIADFSLLSNASILTEEVSDLDQLEELEIQACTSTDSGSVKLLIAEALGSMGLRNTLSTYLEGIVSSNSAFREEDMASLKEKWFMCRLFDEPWNDHAYQTNFPASSDENSNDKISMITSNEDSLTGSRGFLMNGPEGFYECMNKGIKALKAEDFDTFHKKMKCARIQLVDQLSSCGSDHASTWKTVDVIDKLRTLNDLEILSPTTESLMKWLSRTRTRFVKAEKNHYKTALHFKFSENLSEITLKSLPKSTVSNIPPIEIRQHLITILQQVYDNSYELGFYKDADSAIRRLFSVCQTFEDGETNPENALEILRLRMKKACLLERKLDFPGAIRCAKQTIALLKNDIDGVGSGRTALLVDALVRCGEWMTKHKVEPASSVVCNYFIPASHLADSLLQQDGNKTNKALRIHSLLALSELVLTLFDSVSSRVKSLSWQKAGHGLEERREELTNSDLLLVEAKKRAHALRKKPSQELTDAEKEVHELCIYRVHLGREIQNTEAERAKVLASIEEHRTLALQSVKSALIVSGLDERADLSKYIYRLIAIWFSTEEDDLWSDVISTIIGDAIDSIPSFRFVPLTSQLFSRITKDVSLNPLSCQKQLQKLVKKLCIQHPYHCVVPLLAFSNGQKGGSGNSKTQPTLESKKSSAALDLIRSLKSTDSVFMCSLIESYEKLTAAYIHLAMADTKEFYRGNTKRIPMEKVCKTSLRLDRCFERSARSSSYPPCILTKPPPIRPGCDYGDGVEDPIGSERISSFESYFAVTDGGLHRPKIIVCIGSKGGKYTELVKGEDETRQDAVMEQVFEYVNNIMARQRVVTKLTQSVTKVSTRSNLRLVTYNIIPLSPDAGVLEWVNHAIPFGDFITDKGGKRVDDVGAHSRYYPGEWGHAQCRQHLDKAHQSEKRQAFDKVCAHNSPVFRFFFLERFGDSTETWYSARMRYTRSVAVSSIVGHILGIGDRHISNILVHQKSGEVVHIDFGIVFEQGKLLNTPEKVPFRLSRNVIDGMGPLGTEGVFTKSAESTLVVLKENSAALLTILSAIVADPLYKWSISSSKQRNQFKTEKSRNTVASKQIQKPQYSESVVDDNAANETATHAIRKVQEKLQGYEDGISEQQSVIGQISLLINSARDRDNLSSMFSGWAPWV